MRLHLATLEASRSKTVINASSKTLRLGAENERKRKRIDEMLMGRVEREKLATKKEGEKMEGKLGKIWREVAAEKKRFKVNGAIATSAVQRRIMTPPFPLKKLESDFKKRLERKF